MNLRDNWIHYEGNGNKEELDETTPSLLSE